MPTVSEIATLLALRMLDKSGVRAWETDTATRQAITDAANEMAAELAGNDSMATSKFLIDEFDGTPAQLTFGNFAGDFSPTAANDLRHASATDTEHELVLASLGNTAAAQSAKFDFGALRAPMRARCAFELAATPTAGNSISLYIGYSQHATAGTGNPGGLSGTAGAYTGYSSNLAASLKQLDLIGDFVCTAQATTTVQVGKGSGVFVPKERYGILVVYNNSGAAFHSDDVESHVVLDPVYMQGQAT